MQSLIFQLTSELRKLTRRIDPLQAITYRVLLARILEQYYCVSGSMYTVQVYEYFV